MRVFLDESGCLGFSFSKPYLQGGSSRYLCLAFLFVPDTHYAIPSAIITGLYKKYAWKNEKKAASASERQKLEFANLVVQMKTQNPEIIMDCIIVKKENIQPHIAADPNKIYNFMCKLVVTERVKHLPQFEFIPDKRSVKVEAGSSLSDYLQMVLWFDLNIKTKLINMPQESDGNHNLQFVDWLAHIVWAAHEKNKNAPYKHIYPCINIRHLFF